MDLDLKQKLLLFGLFRIAGWRIGAPLARPVTRAATGDDDIGAPVERLVYSREKAAHALGISLATLERRVLPVIATVETPWGARLIPAAELERC